MNNDLISRSSLLQTIDLFSKIKGDSYPMWIETLIRNEKIVDACSLMNVGSKTAPDAHSGSTYWEWISTKEMLPMSHGTLCLVLSDGIVEVGCWSHDKFGNGEWFYVNGEYEIGVTHWMPIPEPPNG